MSELFWSKEIATDFGLQTRSSTKDRLKLLNNKIYKQF